MQRGYAGRVLGLTARQQPQNSEKRLLSSPENPRSQGVLMLHPALSLQLFRTQGNMRSRESLRGQFSQTGSDDGHSLAPDTCIPISSVPLGGHNPVS